MRAGQPSGPKRYPPVAAENAMTPVALAAYAAAGISGANLWTTGLIAFVIAIPGFLIPFAFVFDQGLLLQGNPLHIAYVITTAACGVIAFSAATGGYAFGPLARPARAILFCFAPLLIDPNAVTDVIGAVGVGLVLAWQLWRYKLRRIAGGAAAR